MEAVKHVMFRTYTRSGFTIRALQRSDFEALRTLHASVISALPSKGVFRDIDDKYLLDMLTVDATCFGIFDNDQLVSFSTVRYPSAGGETVSNCLGYGEAATHLIGEFDGSAVLPSYRGKGFQYSLIEARARASLLRGRPITVATISPRNPYSLVNFLRYGMTGRALAYLWGGFERIVVARDHSAKVPHWLNAEECLADDIDQIGRFLSSGMELFDLVRKGTEVRYFFGRRDTVESALLEPLGTGDCFGFLINEHNIRSCGADTVAPEIGGPIVSCASGDVHARSGKDA